MTDPIPVTVIGGYLGSGKTTLINHLLHHANGWRLAIMVNDFGDLAIDAALIQSQDGDVISLSGGCVCCSYGNDLQAALMQLKNADDQPDQIVIEASGVALPGAIGASMTLLRHLRLYGIVTMADAGSVINAAQDKYLSDTIERQLADADIIIVNKADLVDAEALNNIGAWITTINPKARQVHSEQSRVPVALVLDNLFGHSAAADTADTAPTHYHDHQFESYHLQLPARTDATRLATTLAHELSAVLRAKGFVKDHDGEMKTLQIVGKRWSVTAAPSGAPPGLVCIGIKNQIDLGDIQAALNF